jgi:hypothetical protein
MKIFRYTPFLLALVIFIISNFIQRMIDSNKRIKENRIAQIEKDLTSFLQYESLSRADINFAQVHLNAVIASVYNQNTMTTPIYMSTVVQQLRRAYKSLQEATGIVSLNKTATSDGEINSAFSEMTSAAQAGSIGIFTSSYSIINQKILLLLQKLESNIDNLGKEKQRNQNELTSISSKEKIVVNLTLAINFLILLFDHKKLIDKQKE